MVFLHEPIGDIHIPPVVFIGQNDDVMFFDVALNGLHAPLHQRRGVLDALPPAQPYFAPPGKPSSGSGCA